MGDSDGTLTYTPFPNANGVANLTIDLEDSGRGSNTSASQAITITMALVNDEPDFPVGLHQIASEGSGIRKVNGWAASINLEGVKRGGAGTDLCHDRQQKYLAALSPGLGFGQWVTDLHLGNGRSEFRDHHVAHRRRCRGGKHRGRC